MNKIGVLTSIDGNHGAAVFNDALNDLLQDALPAHTIEFLRYQPWGIIAFELLRAAKPNRTIPFYNFRRYRRILNHEFDKLSIKRIPPLNTKSVLQIFERQEYDAVVVAKVVWDFVEHSYLPSFPHAFWLSETLPTKKIGYAVSGHRSNLDLFRTHKEQVTRILSTYSLIGVRDDITMEMMLEAGVDRNVPVERVPDPAFMFEVPESKTEEVRNQYGIDASQPTLGLLLFGKPQFSEAVYLHYRKKGYRVINFNMFNPFVEFNLGHLVDPVEWAALYKTLDFCITDRFHASVMCIKNRVPLVVTEPFPPLSLRHSKVHDLLKHFDLLESYHGNVEENASFDAFFETCEHIESNWKTLHHDRLATRLEEVGHQHHAFLKKIQDIV